MRLLLEWLLVGVWLLFVAVVGIALAVALAVALLLAAEWAVHFTEGWHP